MSDPLTLQGIADRLALQELVTQYAQAIDALDFDRLQELFVPDAVFAAYPGDPATNEAIWTMKGWETIHEGFSGTLRNFVRTHHQLGGQTLELAGENASGVTACTAYHLYENPAADGALWIETMWIHYHDTFTRNEGRWQFATRDLVTNIRTTHAAG